MISPIETASANAARLRQEGELSQERANKLKASADRLYDAHHDCGDQWEGSLAEAPPRCTGDWRLHYPISFIKRRERTKQLDPTSECPECGTIDVLHEEACPRFFDVTLRSQRGVLMYLASRAQESGMIALSGRIDTMLRQLKYGAEFSPDTWTITMKMTRGMTFPPGVGRALGRFYYVDPGVAKGAHIDP